MIKVENLTKFYGDKKAIDDISFSIPKGQVVGLLGLNGAGKSTTMNIITGCISSDFGSVEIDGVSLEEEPIKVKKKIGYLPEIPPLYTDMTVEEYLRFIEDLKSASKTKDSLDEIYIKTGLEEVKNRLIKNLSKGYRQRVGIAAALVGNTDIVILDEPTVGLDPNQINQIRNLIKKLGEEKTVIISSHIMSEIQAVCQRIILIHNGKLIADDTTENFGKSNANGDALILTIEGDIEKILNSINNIPLVESAELVENLGDNTHKVRVVSQGGDLRRDIFFALAKAELPLLSSSYARLSLEQVFLQLTTGEEV